MHGYEDLGRQKSLGIFRGDPNKFHNEEYHIVGCNQFEASVDISGHGGKNKIWRSYHQHSRHLILRWRIFILDGQNFITGTNKSGGDEPSPCFEPKSMQFGLLTLTLMSG